MNYLIKDVADMKTIYGILSVKPCIDQSAMQAAIHKAKAEAARRYDDWNIADVIELLPKEWEPVVKDCRAIYI